MTKNMRNRAGEKGTLLIEAIAMLGLIALVTPTLYKKSAERLQEIQDINAAGQARTFNNVVETFIKSEFGELVEATSSAPFVIELGLNDSSSGTGYFSKGYSSYVPYGFTPGDIKNYGNPRVFVRNDNGRLISYVLYPVTVDPGKKRAARMASLVGANGGIVTKPFGGSNDLQADGTGGAWGLDKDMLQDLITHGASSASSILVENSLMVTSTEPISMSHEDSEKFLYRVPPDESGDPSMYYHNTMVTNLYMGGIPENTDYSVHSRQFNSIYNVRRLTLNTDCNYDFLNDGDSSQLRLGGACEPEVADLYIGKPFAGVSTVVGTLNGNSYEHGFEHSGNTGAAWIYGNLSALKNSFRLFREGAGAGRIEGYDDQMERAAGAYDVLEFSRVGSSSSDVDFSVLRAQNGENATQVSMLEDFMVAKVDSSNVPEFLLGKDSGNTSADGSLIYATGDASSKIVYINGNSDNYAGDRVTHINRQGGVVYINGSSATGGAGDTYINDAGGQLQAGKEAEWILAEGEGNDANLQLLAGGTLSGADNRTFAVGNSSVSENHMIWANSSAVSLRGGLLRAYGTAGNLDNSIAGGKENIASYDAVGPAMPETLSGQLALASRYTDILGSAYFGMNGISSGIDGLIYSRGAWNMGVAGSAWVDGLLTARDAWFHRSGFNELHAGFSSYAAYSSHPERGWFNVYDDKVVIRDPATSSNAEASGDTMFYADSSEVRIFDKVGAAARFNGGVAEIGYVTDGSSSLSNLFMANSDSANVIGSTLVNVYTDTNDTTGKVNIQENAMLFSGHAGDLSSAAGWANTIEARAGRFGIQTENKGQDVEQNMQFYMDKDEAKFKYVDLGVYDDASAAVFKVMPNIGLGSSSSDANVQVRGSFHVTGNEVIHIASSDENRAGKDANVSRGTDAHAMLEVDPEYVQIWAKDGESYAKGEGSGYFAMLKVNPTDIHGGAVSSTVLGDASVYIRRGAIELEESVSGGSSYAANEGYGYIRANRFVSNATGVEIPTQVTKGTVSGNPYDQFMVNPAYTSVMHDIKLTTRGGARLSDILPDYVLKGVYNLANNRAETTPDKEVSNMTTWAHPFIGLVPYAVCPPGYRNLATVVPISFRMGEAGDIMLAKDRFETGLSSAANTYRYIVNPSPRHAKNLAYAAKNNGGRIMQDLTLQRVSSLVYNEVYKSASSFAEFQNIMKIKTEGWFWGLDALHTGSSWSDDDMVSQLYSGVDDQGVQMWSYVENTADTSSAIVTIPTPIYFQQNTWLKTSLVPDEDKKQGWNAYMGFLYNVRDWSNSLGGISANGTVRSNFNEHGYNEGSGDTGTIPGGDAGLVWNMFPVPTYSLEGHATVYCYFDRKAFYDKDGDWKNYIDNIDQLGAVKGTTSSGTGATFRGLTDGKDSSYTKRLNDPSLKYDDPW